MHKLVMIIEPMDDWQEFENTWPEFLRLAEAMPGVRMETACRVEHMLYGGCRVARMYEFFFDNLKGCPEAMSSPQGQTARKNPAGGFTAGRLTIFIAEAQARYDQQCPEAPVRIRERGD